jgi:hypothetical protein
MPELSPGFHPPLEKTMPRKVLGRALQCTLAQHKTLVPELLTIAAASDGTSANAWGPQSNRTLLSNRRNFNLWLSFL